MANLWERYCKFYKSYSQLGMSLDISRMDFPESLLEESSAKFAKAFAALKALEAGEIANPDENRMVGHYWLRTPELAPSAEIREAILREFNKVKEFTARVHSHELLSEKGKPFKHLIIAGIGGSALGPQLVYDCLWEKGKGLALSFVDNTDPDGIEKLFQISPYSPDETLVAVISKSGGTVETRNASLEVSKRYESQGLSYSKHAVAITCEGSKLDKQAKEESWLETFYLWDWVGGRTSITSVVGLLPAALQGVDIDLFIQGASKMDELTRVDSLETNPAALLALMWHQATGGQGEKDMVILPYKDRLMLMSKYLQQLVMESLGKAKDLNGNLIEQGIAVYGNKGSTDQHAYIQQLRDGVNNFFVTFIEVLSDFADSSASENLIEVEAGPIHSGDYLKGFMLGTRQALYENQRQSLTITLKNLNAETLGALIALYERAVSIYAQLVNINAYHQPGVEAGKKAAGAVISLEKQILSLNLSEPKLAEEVAKQLGTEEIETVYKTLEYLSQNSRLKMEGDWHPLKAKFSSF